MYANLLTRRKGRFTVILVFMAHQLRVRGGYEDENDSRRVTA